MSKKEINRIKKATKIAGASSRLISLWVDVDYSTVSRWNSNATQPKEKNLDDIGEILEIDNRMLLAPQGRVDTGLAKAVEKELNRLHKDENIPYEIEHIIDSKKVMVNNVILINKLKDFADQYKKNNYHKKPLYFDKYYKDITDNEIKEVNIFICKSLPIDSIPCFEFLVVNKELGTEKFVAKFARKEDAEEYIEKLVLQ